MDKRSKGGLEWGLVALATLAFALATPAGQRLSGRIPQLLALNLNRQPVQIPTGLSADKTLVLVGFKSGQSKDIDAWIQGMQLHQRSAIAWVRMPVFNDSGDGTKRNEVQQRLESRFTSTQERANVVPVFTDRESFLSSVGLESADQVSALVLARDGEVLARVDGSYSPEKQQELENALTQP